MNHPDDATLQTFYDGELPAADTHVLETHLASCAQCVAKGNGLRALTGAFGRWADDAPLGDDLTDAIFAKLDAPSASTKVVPIERARELRERKSAPLRRVLFPAVALAAAAAVALWMGSRPESVQPERRDERAHVPSAPEPIATPPDQAVGIGGAEVVRIDVQGAQSYAVLSVPGMNPGVMTAVVWIQDSPETPPSSAAQ